MPLPLSLPSGLSGEIQYGAVSFDASAETTAFDIKVVYTEDGRWVKHTEVSITIRGYVTTNEDDPENPDYSTDNQMNIMRIGLQTPGLPFVYTSGAGDFSINTGVKSWNLSTQTKDIAFGPKPQLIRFKPLDGSKAAKVLWSVIVTLAECPSKVFQGLKEFNYKIAWQLTRGLTRRTCSGFYEIMNNGSNPEKG